MLDVKTAQRSLRDWREALPGKLIVAGVGSRDLSSHNSCLIDLGHGQKGPQISAQMPFFIPLPGCAEIPIEIN